MKELVRRFDSRKFMSIGAKCEKCGNDEWTCFSTIDSYVELCNRCCAPEHNILIDLKYKDIKNNYQCPKCNCFECEIEENQKAIATRCKHCGDQQIVYQKKVTDGEVYRPQEQSSQPNNQPKCPTCGSTNIQKISTAKRAGSIIGFGILSKNIGKIFECKKCGYKW